MRPAACLLLVGLLTLLLARRLGAQAGGGPGFSTPGYNQIQDSGTNLPKRRILDCEPAGTCTDDPANNRTKITMTGGGGGGAPTNAKYLLAACDPTLTAEELLVAGAGLASTEVAGNCGTLTLATASQETAFLANGGTTALTCTGGQGAGSAQVLADGTLQWCDGNGTPHLRSVSYVFNVRDYGAKADGVTDDGPAMQAALDAAAAAGQGTVWIPAGTYFIDQGLEVGDNTEVMGVWGASRLNRGGTPTNHSLYTGAGNCATNTGTGKNQHNVFRNKKPKCGNANISLHDLVLDGSQVGTSFCRGGTGPGSGAFCPGGGLSGPNCKCSVNGDCQSGNCDAKLAPNGVAVAFSAVTDLHVERLLIQNNQQDAIFVENGGVRSTIRNNTITGFNQTWGNGSGINVEMHETTVNNPGIPLIEENVVQANGPNFCELDLKTTCAVDGDCTAAYSGGFNPATQCLGSQNPIFCCTGIGTGSGCNLTCGTGASTVAGISMTYTSEAGTPAPEGLITKNRVDVSDLHFGIICSGCQNTQVTDNKIRGVDTAGGATAATKIFTGIQVQASSAARPLNNVTVARNTMVGGAASGDRRCLLVDDGFVPSTCGAGTCTAGLCVGGATPGASCGSGRIVVAGNICQSKALGAAFDAMTIRGMTDVVVAGNVIEGISASHGLRIGSGGTQTTNVQVTDNSISDVTAGSMDCLILQNTTSATVAGNSFRNCSRGIETLSSPTGTRLLGNAYASVTTPILFSSADATLFLDEPFVSFTASGLPAGAQDGSRTYCSNCGSSNPCAAGSGSYLALHVNGAWTCDGFPTGSGSTNRVAFWGSGSNLTFNSGFSFNGSSLAFSTLRSFVGISPLHLEFGGTSESFLSDVYNSAANGPQWVGRHARGTPGGSELPMSSGDVLLTVGARGWAGNGTPGNGAFSTGSRAKIEAFASQPWAAGVEGTRWDFSVTPNGGTSTNLASRIDQDGALLLTTPGTALPTNPSNSGVVANRPLESTVATGTPPLRVASTTAVANLHASNTDAIQETSGPTTLTIAGIADNQCLKRSGTTVTSQACTAGAYTTVQEEGAGLTQRGTLNFIGSAITAADDAGNTRTNVTLSESPSASTSVVGTGRQVLTSGAALSGGGDLSADRTVTLSESPNSASVVGTGRQVLTSGAALSGGGDLSADRTVTLSESPNSASVVGTARTVTAGTCLTGGGDLSADRTLTLAATCSQAETFSGGIDLAASGLSIDVTNDTVTGTTLNKLAKLTLTAGQAIVAATTDVSGIVGIVTAGAGTTGSAQIAREGIASCVFDGATTAGDYVRISPGVAGDCRDDGGSFPTGDGQVLGRVLSTNGSGGTYAVLLYAGELPFSMSPAANVAANPAVVGTGRQLLTNGAALSGGGNLSADRTVTLSESPNSASVVGTGRTLTAGNGLTGTGDLSADRTFDVGAGSCITVAADSVAVTNACVTAASLAAGGFANPSANVGFTVVNGSATTAMRSDAAPALAAVPAGMIRDMAHAQLGGL